MVTELIREAPAYKKAVLAVAVTAGVGACVYLGYRQLSGPQTSDKPRGPSKVQQSFYQSGELGLLRSDLNGSWTNCEHLKQISCTFRPGLIIASVYAG